jgi:hypothetical protein
VVPALAITVIEVALTFGGNLDVCRQADMEERDNAGDCDIVSGLVQRGVSRMWRLGGEEGRAQRADR